MAQSKMWDDDEDDNILSDTPEKGKGKEPKDFLDNGVTILNVSPGTHQLLINRGILTLRDVLQHDENFYRNQVDGLGPRKVSRLLGALDDLEYSLPMAHEEDEDEDEDEDERDLALRKHRELPSRKSRIETKDVLANRFGSFTCPECGNGFPKKVSLGVHRMMKHGVKGTSPNSIKARKGTKKRTKKTHSNIIPNYQIKKVNGLYRCPECGLEYSLLSGLGNHRKGAHGVDGGSNTAEARRFRQQVKEGKHGRGHESTRDVRLSSNQQPIIELRPSDFNPEPAHKSTQEDTNHDFFEYSAGYAEGHIRTWIDFYCQQTGGKLSADKLTKRLAELLGG